MIAALRPVTLALLAALPMVSDAGSPGGLHILALPTSKAVMYEPVMKKFFDEFNVRNIPTDCGETHLQIDRVYYDGARIKTSGDAALRAMTSSAEHRKLGKKMAAFRHPGYELGFDAAVVYDVKGDLFILYGISQFHDIKKYTSKIALSDVNDIAKLTKAVCLAASRLPVQWND